MTKNPFYNALAASAYIIILIIVIFRVTHFAGGQQASIWYPILALSILVLSVALMAYLFFYQPVLLFLKGEQAKGVKLFLYTVGIFAIFTLIISIITVLVNR